MKFGRFDLPGFDVRGDTIAALENYPGKSTGELGAFFDDSERSLRIAQALREGVTRG